MYKNKDWLYQKYIVEKLSSIEISKIINVHKVTILNWLRNHNIPIRSNSESKHIWQANHFDITNEFREWIDGELLGDGCLNSRSKYSARVKYSSKYLEYIDYIAESLKHFGIEQSGYIRKREPNPGAYSYHYTSKSYNELKDFHTRWYPEGKKIVPRDVRLTPITLRQWYLGDGCLYIPKTKRRRFITLAAYSFTDDDVYFLIKLFREIGIVATKPKSNRIHISTQSVDKFLDYIGECPVYCYQYKWR